MGKVAQSSVKYVIKAELNASGLVEKPDIVGAIFGQTEGLLGEDLDLRELQERGRIGRIDVQVKEDKNGSKAVIKIPSSLDATETALIGASLETIERVGPTNADIRVKEVRDERTSKRDYIVKRAKQLLNEIQTDSPGKAKITEEVKEEVRTTEIDEYYGFQAGPDVEDVPEVILVEGRADLLNLLKNGVKNAIALGGTSIPDNVEEIGEEKKLTAFLDGDRGGDLILKELGKKAEPEFVARAPDNKEVEELGKEDIYKALRDKEPYQYSGAEEVEEDEGLDDEVAEKLTDLLDELVGTRAVNVLNDDLEVESKFPLKNSSEGFAKIDSCFAIVMDGEIDEDIIEECENAGADYVAGMKKTGYANSSQVEIITREQLRKIVAEH